MKRWSIGTLAFSLATVALLGVAQAQYRPSSSAKGASSESDGFERAVDLKRFRKGTIEWDTQELIASGLSALHREHQQILRELEELRAEGKRLEARR